MTPKPQSLADALEEWYSNADEYPADLKILIRGAILLEGAKRKVQNRWINTQEAEEAKDAILAHIDPALSLLEAEIQRVRTLQEDAKLAAELKANKDAPVQDFEAVCEELRI